MTTNMEIPSSDMVTDIIVELRRHSNICKKKFDDLSELEKGHPSKSQFHQTEAKHLKFYNVIE